MEKNSKNDAKRIQTKVIYTSTCNPTTAFANYITWPNYSVTSCLFATREIGNKYVKHS